ncbi:MAG: biopolymer transporter ExbD [Planctomycetota bacterium]|nr:biopolymer transporter ExbD [Planctomycetota bacterium]
MAKRKRKFELDPEPKPDLTPMIDIVFNLIIFFMIVSELSNLTVEQLQLPFADRSEEPRPGGVEKILQVNVMPTGIVKIRSQAYTGDPQLKGKYPWLQEFLEIEAAGYEREPPEPGQPGTPPSALRVNIRADKEVKFQYVQQVFDACVRNGIYKTSIGATRDDPKN